jgi:hypothetical protein
MVKGDGFKGEYEAGAEARGDDMLIRIASMLRIAEPIPPSLV